MLNVKTTLKPNPGKKIEITVDGAVYHRYPIKTEVFKKGDDYAEKISKEVVQLLSGSATQPNSTSVSQQIKPGFNKNLKLKIENLKWYVVVSEKIIAISQGRSYFIKDIHPSWIATTLSKFVKKTPYGIGLGSPWTMQLAIQEVGLVRILFAAFMSVVTKPFGFDGVFYHVAGREAAAIDGPTSYSLYPSNISAKLAPKDPQKASEEIAKRITYNMKRFNDPRYAPHASRFSGVVIIDANDLGRNVLGNSTDKPNSFFEKVMRDNPMGQGSEGTPLVILI